MTKTCKNTKHKETRAYHSMSGLVCKRLCDCLYVCVRMYPCLFVLSEFPCIKQIVGIIPGLDLHLSCCFFHAVVVLWASRCCSFHSKDLVQKALSWALWRHILNWSCHDMTAPFTLLSVHPTLSLSLCLGAHHWHLEEEMDIAAITSPPLLHGRSTIFLLWFL